MKTPVENEIKLRLGDSPTGGLAKARALLRRLGFAVKEPRVFEQNLVLDDSQNSLRERGMLLRVRAARARGKASHITCTYKGPETQGRHKRREEREFRASDFSEGIAVFAALGFHEVFRYEKYRTEFARAGEPGHITLDEMPIGVFMELEGPPRWVDATAKEMGFPRSAYITDSYGRLFERWREETGSKARDMRFSRRRRSK